MNAKLPYLEMKSLPALLLVVSAFVVGLLTGRLMPPPNQIAAEASVLEIMTKADDIPTAGTAEVDTKSGEPRSTPMTLSELASEIDGLRQLEPGSEQEIKASQKFRARLRASDLGALAKAIVDSYPSATSQDLLHMVISEFATQRPDEAWRLLLGLRSPQLRRQAGWAFSDALANKDINKALAFITQLPDSQLKMEMRQTAINSLACRDPERAFTLEVQFGGSQPDFEPNMEMWVTKDPDAAIRAVSNLKGALFPKAARNLISALATRDPQKAWKYAQSLPPHEGDKWDDPRYVALSNWGLVDPEAALFAASSVGDTEIRGECIADIVRSWAESDFSSALAYANSVEDAPLKAKVLVQMTSASHAPQSELFAALIEHGPVGDSYSAANVMERWASQDPKAAAQALAQLPPSQRLDETTAKFVRGWLSANDSNPKDVLSWARSLPEKTTMREKALTAVLQEIGKTDPELGRRLISGLDESSRLAAWKGLAEGWSSKEPTEAAAWALTLPNEVKNDVMWRVMENWANRNPLEAANKAAKSDASGNLVAGVVSQWLRGSPAQAADWVDKLPHGEIRDAGLSTVAEVVSQEDPSAAVLWAARISSSSSRAEQMQRICSRWVEVDPTNAKRWIASSLLSPEAKSSLMSK